MSEQEFNPDEEEQIKKVFNELDHYYQRRTIFWKLDENKNPVPATSDEFDFQMRNFEKYKCVRFTRIDPYVVSTVFLGIDHAFGSDLPVLFETMVYSTKTAEHKFLDEQWRYCTWQEASEGHQAVVKLVEGGLSP